MATQLSGKCLCGAVTLSTNVEDTDIGACHCSQCRRWGGGPMLALECAEVAIQGVDDAVTIYNSSDWAERGFCRHCGTHLFYRLKDNNFHAIPAGLFKSNSDFHFKQQIFIDEKPDYYQFANQTNNLTGAEVFAQFDAAE